MGRRLDAKATSVTFVDVAAALEAAWVKLLAQPPKRESVAVLLAQSALETGHWKKCFCYNLGNAKAGPSWGGDFTFYTADEIVSEEHAARAFHERAPRTDGVVGHNVELVRLNSGLVQVKLYPDHSWCRFRAFETLNDGALDYLELLHRRFKAAWPAVEAGDPEGFVRTLREQRYFTASLERYLPPVLQLFGKFKNALASDPGLPIAEPAVPVTKPATGRPTLRRGTSGPFVSEVQRILIAMGYDKVTDSGRFDETTVRAVELFQLQHIDEKGRPLTADGEVGKNTWWALLNPSSDAQRSFIPAPSGEGLTPARQKLLVILDAEHRKPVFETPDGSNRSPDIDRYFANTGIKGQPWCCAFVSFALKEALGKLPVGGKHHLGVQAMWVAARELGMEVAEPKPGDVFIQIKSGGTGHTGFVVGVSEDGKSVFTCEGNCGNRLKYGLRPLSSIHHFIDVIRDGQGQGFARGANVAFESLDGQGTT